MPNSRGTVPPFCKTCDRMFNAWMPAETVVSASGIAHVGKHGRKTLCGKAATGKSWWWEW